MSWDMKCWDLFYKFYWSLPHIGMKADRPTESGINDGVKRYVRSHSIDQTSERLNGDEDILNFFLDIFLSIAPDRIIHRLLVSHLISDDGGPFRSLGFRECASRYKWGHANVTQPDGFIVSEKSLICVEIKLNAPTSRDQVLKYAGMCLLEESLSGPRQNIGLIYVVPPKRAPAIIQTIGGRPGQIGGYWIDVSTSQLKGFARKLHTERSEEFRSVLDRMTITVVSWQDVYQGLKDEIATLDPLSPQDQTLYRLLNGFMNQLQRHKNTGIEI
ncbi:MAG: hypothetical protein AB7F36_09270 [Reyranellaceae bacterium]